MTRPLVLAGLLATFALGGAATVRGAIAFRVVSAVR